MCFIVLRNGKVLQYNNGGRIIIVENTVSVLTKGGAGLVARVPVDIVERAEFERPYRILRAKKAPKRPRY